jgi:hypothetical protein
MKVPRRRDRQLYRVFGEEDFLPDHVLGEWDTWLGDGEPDEEAEANGVVSEPAPGQAQAPSEDRSTEAQASLTSSRSVSARAGTGRRRMAGVTLLIASTGAVIAVIVVADLRPGPIGGHAAASAVSAGAATVVGGRRHPARARNRHRAIESGVAGMTRRPGPSGGFRQAGGRATRSGAAIDPTTRPGTDVRRPGAPAGVGTRVLHRSETVAWQRDSEFGFER